MKIQLLCLAVLTGAIAFGAQAPEKPAEKGALATVMTQINSAKKKRDKKIKRHKNNDYEYDPQIETWIGIFDNIGPGCGLADAFGLHMQDDGTIVEKDPQQQ